MRVTIPAVCTALLAPLQLVMPFADISDPNVESHGPKNPSILVARRNATMSSFLAKVNKCCCAGRVPILRVFTEQRVIQL